MYACATCINQTFPWNQAHVNQFLHSAHYFTNLHKQHFQKQMHTHTHKNGSKGVLVSLNRALTQLQVQRQFRKPALYGPKHVDTGHLPICAC